jgi:hypothetical protein
MLWTAPLTRYASHRLGHSRPVRAGNGSVHARYALKADVESGYWHLARWTFAEWLHTLQSSKKEPRMMRYELKDYEWAAIS